MIDTPPTDKSRKQKYKTNDYLLKEAYIWEEKPKLNLRWNFILYGADKQIFLVQSTWQNTIIGLPTRTASISTLSCLMRDISQYNITETARYVSENVIERIADEKISVTNRYQFWK